MKMNRRRIRLRRRRRNNREERLDRVSDVNAQRWRQKTRPTAVRVFTQLFQNPSAAPHRRTCSPAPRSHFILSRRTVNYNRALVLVYILVHQLILLSLLLLLGILIYRIGVPCWKLSKLIYGGFGILNEPINNFSGVVITKTVLDVVELNGSMNGEMNSSISIL